MRRVGRLQSKCSEERKEQGSGSAESEREPTAGGDSAVLRGVGWGRLTGSGSVEGLSNTLKGVEATPRGFIRVDGAVKINNNNKKSEDVGSSRTENTYKTIPAPQ